MQINENKNPMKKSKKKKIRSCKGKKGGCFLIQHEEMVAKNYIYGKAA